MAATYDDLRQRLQEEQGQLTNQLEHLQAGALSPNEPREGSPFGKKEEGATETFELEKRLALKRRLTEAIGDVEHALSKFEQGNYGLCDSCGKAINAERLEVFPQASLCLDCKASQGKNAKVKHPPR